jgi:hypothetical protein
MNIATPRAATTTTATTAISAIHPPDKPPSFAFCSVPPPLDPALDPPVPALVTVCPALVPPVVPSVDPVAPEELDVVSTPVVVTAPCAKSAASLRQISNPWTRSLSIQRIWPL